MMLLAYGLRQGEQADWGAAGGAFDKTWRAVSKGEAGIKSEEQNRNAGTQEGRGTTKAAAGREPRGSWAARKS